MWLLQPFRHDRTVAGTINGAAQVRQAKMARIQLPIPVIARKPIGNPMIRTSASFGVVLAVATMALAAARSAEPVAVTVGATSTTSDAPIYIADKLGYFSDEGLSVTVVLVAPTVTTTGSAECAAANAMAAAASTTPNDADILIIGSPIGFRTITRIGSSIRVILTRRICVAPLIVPAAVLS